MTEPLDPEALYKLVLGAFQHLNRADTPEPDPLLPRLLSVRARLPEAATHDTTALQTALNGWLSQLLADLEPQNTLYHRALTLRFVQNEKIIKAAHDLNYSQDQFNRLQREAILSICNTITVEETRRRQTYLQHNERGLPTASYDQLVGFDTVLASLHNALLDFNGAGIWLVTGIGGIGKTALAHAAARAAISEYTFTQVAWLTLEVGEAQNNLDGLLRQLGSKLLPTHKLTGDPRAPLRDYLKSQPALVVLDNLELDADVAALLAVLPEMTGPSRVVLTTRSLPGVAVQYPAIVLQELTTDDARQLIRNQAQRLNLPELTDASNADLDLLYAAVGGNPFALKLLTSLCRSIALPTILADLETAHLEEVDNMYRRIYWRVWGLLSDPAKQLLAAMPLSSETGALPVQMEIFSGLDAATMWPAVEELLSYSLLEVRGTLTEKRYGIHRLTRAFLNSDILGLPSAK